jgi:hypothetical protein
VDPAEPLDDSCIKIRTLLCRKRFHDTHHQMRGSIGVPSMWTDHDRSTIPLERRAATRQTGRRKHQIQTKVTISFLFSRPSGYFPAAVDRRTGASPLLQHRKRRVSSAAGAGPRSIPVQRGNMNPFACRQRGSSDLGLGDPTPVVAPPASIGVSAFPPRPFVSAGRRVVPRYGGPAAGPRALTSAPLTREGSRCGCSSSPPLTALSKSRSKSAARWAGDGLIGRCDGHPACLGRTQ